MISKLSFFFLSLFILGCVASNNERSVLSYSSAYMPIAVARTMPLGTKVRLLGTVTVPSGAFASSTPFGYAMQDSTAGIYVIESGSPVTQPFKIGDLVEVTGTTQTVNAMTIIEQTKALKMGKGGDIAPRNMPTGQVGKASEGLILQVTGRIDSLKNDMPYGYKVFINDGSGPLTIFFNDKIGLMESIATLKLMDSISVIGLSASYNGIYEIEPRGTYDFKVLSSN